MTDKVQKIRKEVERLMYGFNLEADIASCEDAETEKLADIKYQLCQKILEYIDSLQEEPVSEDLEKAAKEHSFIDGSEDIDEYAQYNLEKYESFKAGSKWQKEQFEKGKLEALEGVVDFGNSLQEESVSKDLEEAMQHNAPDNIGIDDLLYWRNGFIIGANWQKQQDLIPSTELSNFIDKLSKQFPEVSFAKLSRIAVRVAKWQQQQEYTCYEEAFEDGAKWKYEQMMKGAIDAKIGSFTNGTIYDADFNIDSNLKDSDKVKVIVIKEECR